MASISQRGDVWRVRLSDGRRRFTKTFPDEAQAEAWAKKMDSLKEDRTQPPVFYSDTPQWFPLVADEPDSTNSDLYVLQNAFGVIKIGRSKDVAFRVRTIELASGIPTYLVASFPGKGNIEFDLHRRFQEHRRVGEWFEDSPQFRADLSAELSVDLAFPVSYQRMAA